VHSKRSRTWLFVVMTVSLAFGGCSSTKPSATVRPTATAPAPTVAALNTPLPSQGWVTVPELALMRSLAFAKSDPLTGYACGASFQVAQTPTDVLQLSVTHDGGRTWSAAAPTTVQGSTCRFAINPARADDVIMTAIACYKGCGYGPLTSYRSHDSGKTWVKLEFDTTQWASGGLAPWEVYSPAWIGDTAYFAVVPENPLVPQNRPEHVLVSNTTGNLLSAARGGVDSLVSDPQSSPQAIWAHDAMLVVTFNSFPAPCVESTDGGATWQRFTPSIQGTTDPVQNILFSDGALALVNYHPARSDDGGKTWQPLPPVPPSGQGGFVSAPFHLAPDGTIIYVLPNTIWRLAPGATTWTTAATLITGPQQIPADFLAFSTDRVGHAVLAWSEATVGTLQPGVAYHGLG
jgi:hypothetical protein